MCIADNHHNYNYNYSTLPNYNTRCVVAMVGENNFKAKTWERRI